MKSLPKNVQGATTIKGSSVLCFQLQTLLKLVVINKKGSVYESMAQMVPGECSPWMAARLRLEETWIWFDQGPWHCVEMYHALYP